MKYQGAFDIKADSDSKMISLSKSASGKYTSDTINEAMTSVLEFISKNKGYAFNRWDFYVPDVNQKLDFNDKRLPTDKVIKAFKDGFIPTVALQRFGKPKVIIASPVKTTSGKAKAKTNTVLL